MSYLSKEICGKWTETIMSSKGIPAHLITAIQKTYTANIIRVNVGNFTAHKERGQLGDQRNDGENNCNSGDGTGQMAQPWMFMMMMMMMINTEVHCWLLVYYGPDYCMYDGTY